MEIHFTNSEIGNDDFEIVERKGVGHPDTLSDMIAEEFSNRYSCYCLENFNSVLNHWSDKVVLSGGIAELEWGSFNIKKPVTAYLFGKAVESIDGKKIPIRELFIESTEKVIGAVFENEDFLKQIKYVVDVNDGIGKEHLNTFYSPKTENDVRSVETFKSNDTVICSGFAPYSVTEKIAIDLENYINGEFKKMFNYTGTDVKVVIIRNHLLFDITVCIPFIALKTESFNFYKEKKQIIQEHLQSYLHQLGTIGGAVYKISLNTKDFAEQGYLVAYSSALDKGDFGAVGRGNKYSGVISLNRKTNIEAVPGKNPQNHSGKLYTIFAHRLAWKIFALTNIPVSVDVVARNGGLLSDPAHVIIDMCSSEAVDDLLKPRIEEIVRQEIKKVESYIDTIIYKDVIMEHKERQYIYE